MNEEISDFERLVLLVRDTIADDSIEFGVFRLAENEHASLRRVVWIPTDFTCEQIEKTQQDVLHTDYLTVECQVYGRNFADACAIRRQVCNAVRRVMGVSSEAADGVYQTEAFGAAGIMWGGHSKIIQRFVWRMNVARSDEQYAVIKEIDLCDQSQVSSILVAPPVLRLEQELAIKTQG